VDVVAVGQFFVGDMDDHFVEVLAIHPPEPGESSIRTKVLAGVQSQGCAPLGATRSRDACGCLTRGFDVLGAPAGESALLESTCQERKLLTRTMPEAVLNQQRRLDGGLMILAVLALRHRSSACLEPSGVSCWHSEISVPVVLRHSKL
jgi:hypothetical protein